MDSYQTTVTVDGEECKLTVVKRGKTWKAQGEFKGQHLTGLGAPNDKKAIENWKSRAKYSQPDM